MIIKALILTALLSNDPIVVAMPIEKIEANRKRGKKGKGRKKGGNGLR